MSLDLITNQWIPSQFPAFYNKDGPLFIAFMKAYMEWMESEGQPIYHSRNLLDYRDIDKTPAQFLQYFKNQYLLNLPPTLVNPRLLIKHVLDLYRAKGTKRAYELLFRILFDQDIQIYLPSEHIFKLSDNTWIQQGYLEITDSPFNSQLIGLSIVSSTNQATALVEDFNIININNKVVNVLTVSNVVGNFNYGSFVLSPNLPALNISNAPIVVGSLSAVSIENGGALFNVGDVVTIEGTGSGSSSLGRVSSVRSENGKVIFTLENGGFGFSLNPNITVTGGGGSGATFKVGSLVDQSSFQFNTDVINTYYNVQLDNTNSGFNLVLNSIQGTFAVNETVNAAANGIALDFAYLSGLLSNTETLSNTSLGISGLEVIEIDNPNFVNLTGPEASLNNANLVAGITLLGGTSGASIYVNSVLGKQQYVANGKVTFANSTLLTVINATGYFLPTSKITGVTSHANAFITQTIRDTNWEFPLANSGNLDQSILSVLQTETIVVGTITSLIDENPGNNYTSSPAVSIIEPLIFSLQIPDGQGGFWGGDANVVGIANNTSGIITSLNIIDSGYGFSPSETVEISSNNNPISAEGVAIVDGTGVSQGYWKNNKSFLSDEMYLQDSNYYQAFSYEIIAPLMIDVYQQFVTDIVHPVQMKMFGRFAINDIQYSQTSLVEIESSQIDVATAYTYYFLGF